MNRLKLLREEKKWTQKYLGSLLHVKNAAISKYETSRSSLTEETIIKAAELFNVTTDYLLGLTDIRNNFENITSDNTDSTAQGIKYAYDQPTINMPHESIEYNTQRRYTDDEKKLLTYFNRLDDENKDYIKGRMVDLYKEQQNLSSEKSKRAEAN
jgi:transcriptional regulator with XRE-family HTH domain